MAQAFQIRAFKSADVSAAYQLRRDSIYRIVADAYDPLTLDAWAGTPDAEGEARFLSEAAREVRIVMVHQGQLAGYASFIRTNADINGLFVSPGRLHQGCGRELLTALEHEAVKFGHSKMWVTSALNTIAFFEAHDYEFVSDTSHALPGGLEIPSARLVKRLLPI